MDKGTGVTTVTGGQTSGKQALINWQTEGMSVEETGDAVAMGTGVIRERGAGNGTHLRRTAISFSMLLSFPFSAFLGMHFTANIFPVDLSSARTTSENAPL